MVSDFWRQVLGSGLIGAGGGNPALAMAMLQQQKEKEEQEKARKDALAPIGQAFAPRQYSSPSPGGAPPVTGMAPSAPSPQSLAPMLAQGLASGAIGPADISQFMALAQAQQPPPPRAPTITKPGDIARDEAGNIVYQNPTAPEYREVNGVLGQVDATGFAPVPGAPGPKPNPNQPFNPDGTPNKAYQDYERAKVLAGRTQVNTTLNAGNSFASGLGGKTADMMEARNNAATGALDSIETGNRILAALDSGKVIAGPGATWRVFGAQLFGSDPEALQQTRTVIQGLAGATLAARQELKGQGTITDREGIVLEKARSGQIDELTQDEIRTIVKVNDRLSRIKIRNNRSFLEKARNIPGAPADFLNMFIVDEPPEYQRGGSYQSADDVAAAYRAGTISRDAAAKILREKGWAD